MIDLGLANKAFTKEVVSILDGLNNEYYWIYTSFLIIKQNESVQLDIASLLASILFIPTLSRSPLSAQTNRGEMSCAR